MKWRTKSAFDIKVSDGEIVLFTYYWAGLDLWFVIVAVETGAIQLFPCHCLPCTRYMCFHWRLAVTPSVSPIFIATTCPSQRKILKENKPKPLLWDKESFHAGLASWFRFQGQICGLIMLLKATICFVALYEAERESDLTPLVLETCGETHIDGGTDLDATPGKHPSNRSCFTYVSITLLLCRQISEFFFFCRVELFHLFHGSLEIATWGEQCLFLL